MLSCTRGNYIWVEPSVIAPDVYEDNQTARIMTALGLTGDCLPKVDEDTLFRYYEYLSANLLVPFAVYYPRPTNAREQSEFRCYAWVLLDPANHFSDGFEGIFFITRNGKYELKLPLIELELPEDSPNRQLIEDYCYWFWNWR